MDEKRLRAFIETADRENISQAAAALYMAQPALSKLLQAMEEELGYPLFDRLGKRIMLNENGALYYTYAKRIVQEYENARNEIKERNHRKITNLCVGVSATSQLLPDLIRQFKKHHPAEEAQIQMKISYPLNFIKDSMDILIDSELHRTERTGKDYLLHEKLLLALPRGHALEKKERLYIKDIQEYPCVLPAENTGMGKLLRTFFEENSVRFSFDGTTTNNSYVQCELVAKGMGISFIPEKSWIYARSLPTILLRPIRDVSPERYIYCQYHPGKYKSDLMVRFGEFLKRYYGNL